MMNSLHLMHGMQGEQRFLQNFSEDQGQTVNSYQDELAYCAMRSHFNIDYLVNNESSHSTLNT